MKQYPLDTSILPQVWLTWASTKNKQFNKRYWLNCQTNEKKEVPEDWMTYTNENSVETNWSNWKDLGGFGISRPRMQNGKIWINSGTKLRCAYIKYHPDIDRLEIASVGLDTTRNGEHKWEYMGDRCFIAKDKTIINADGKKMTNMFNVDDIYHWSVPDFKYFLSILLRREVIASAVDEFKKFIGKDYFTIGDGKSITIDNYWHIAKWYETVQKSRGNGKAQKLTDELTSISLSDASDFAKKYPVFMVNPKAKNAYDKEEMRNVLYYEKVNDDWYVLRHFYRNQCDDLVEDWRLYFDKEDNVRPVSHSGDWWIPSKQSHDSYWSGGYTHFVNMDEAIASCNRIKYILNSVEDLRKTKIVDFITLALRFPEIEQLIKFGHQKEALYMIASNTPKADLKSIFGNYWNDKEKNLLRKIGLTKKQFDTYMTYHQLSSHDSERALSKMRIMFGNDLSSLDFESFDKYFNACKELGYYFWSRIDNYLPCLDLDLMRFFKNLVRLSAKSSSIYRVASDALSDYIGLNEGTAPVIDWYFDSVSDAVRIHDAISQLKRVQDDERRAMWDRHAAERRAKEEERRIKVDEERKQYEYEDGNYIIRLPKSIAEIVEEGSKQHICIGGYTTRHANGETNLFFLRKKDCESIPFYAIEMNRDKNIVQIHGNCNKWLGCDPDAIPTVVRWLRKNGITCREQILTCKATGYGACNDYVPMPVVD